MTAVQQLQQRYYQFIFGLLFIRIGLAVWDTLADYLYIQDTIAEPLSLLSFLVQNFDPESPQQFEFIYYLYFNLHIFLIGIYLVMLLARSESTELRHLRLGSIIYAGIQVLHIIRMNQENNYFEVFSEIRDYPGFYLVLLDMMMVAVFWTLSDISKDMNKLRLYGVSLFGFLLMSGVILAPLLNILGNVMDEDIYFGFGFYFNLYTFFVITISCVLGVKVLQYSRRAIGWVQSEHNTELYATKA